MKNGGPESFWGDNFCGFGLVAILVFANLILMTRSMASEFDRPQSDRIEERAPQLAAEQIVRRQIETRVIQEIQSLAVRSAAHRAANILIAPAGMAWTAARTTLSVDELGRGELREYCRRFFGRDGWRRFNEHNLEQRTEIFSACGQELQSEIAGNGAELLLNRQSQFVRCEPEGSSYQHDYEVSRHSVEVPAAFRDTRLKVRVRYDQQGRILGFQYEVWRFIDGRDRRVSRFELAENGREVRHSQEQSSRISCAGCREVDRIQYRNMIRADATEMRHLAQSAFAHFCLPRSVTHGDRPGAGSGNRLER